MSQNPIFTIALDFDGTCVEHRYPFIGKDVPHCVETLKEWTDKYNVGIILYTMRSDKLLADAVKWFTTRHIPLYGVNVNPTQDKWTNSPKCHATICIDDRNVGCPLKWDSEKINPMVDWKKIKTMVDSMIKNHKD